MNIFRLSAITIGTSLATLPALGETTPCLEFAAGAAHPPVFEDRSSSPRDVAALDANGDGHLDLAVSGQGDGVAILLGDGSGAFSLLATFEAGPFEFFREVFAADVDGDGDADLVVTQGDTALILENVEGVFAPPVAIDAEFGFVFSPSAAIADINGDLAPEIILNGQADQIALNDGAGGFVETSSYDLALPGGGEPRLAVGDVDDDGDADIVGVIGNGGQSGIGIGVTLNDGKGGFDALPFDNTLDVEGVVTHVLLTDLDDDDRPDLIVRVSAGRVAMFAGDGAGGFELSDEHVVSRDFGRRMTAADMDGDGHADVLVPGGPESPLNLLRGRGDGTFRPAVLYAPIFGAAAAVGAFDGVPGLDAVSGRVLLANRTAPVVPGDVNGDGVVNFEDVLLVLANWTR